ncbi:acetyl-CoA C-acetyltransferase [Aurantiacibacter atlanticus]|uniref:Acetyl-CoA C-acetyltransferase n=1 Tax=Aurantiacibacter atlanticus TaxID=1648404 RepID=A0A0H4VGH3_9SPHN|nr:thiolase family protein [Aurantiacibacter atlanticus]AKQ41926.1 acetyl-CoA C-acetyltransferase [Aurantiacibacter atlanticus]MDF1833969.1 thiolase family protein [Alteraurantiacibacter sp. bin_em_oilr2.035]
MTDVVIAGYVRSPFHPAHRGALAKVRPDDLAANTIKGLIERTGVNADDIEDLIMGCAFPEAEQGFNIARLVVLLADLPISIGGITMNRFCGSSMSAVHYAAGQIALGAGEVFICAGVESMSRVPMSGFNPMPNPKLAEKSSAYIGMGDTAENVARKYNFSREAQEAFAVNSQQKAGQAIEKGAFKDEIVPINLPDGTLVDRDGTPRPDTTAEGLAGLKLSFDENGSVTAGTASPLTDGSAALLVCSADYAAKNGLSVIAKVKSMAISGCAPEIMGIGPVEASKKALSRAGLTIDDIDVVELNEAFSSQSLACIGDLGIEADRINLDGGAIAIGHPLGATGARIVGKAASLLKREGKKYALATQCIGGGQGIATILETA